MLSEKHSLLSQTVNIRSGKFLLAITAQITVSKVVSKDVYYVWQGFFLIRLCT
jgi:hypothetical protein